MNSPIKRLKVPIGMYRQANKKGLLKTIIFYYRLKSLSIHGSFRFKTFNSLVQDNLLVSYNTAKKYISLLLKNKFVILDGEFIHLKSYDQIWSLLEVPLINKRYKLIYTNLQTFEEDIYIEEIRFNFKKQEKVRNKKYLKKELNTSGLDADIYANKTLKKLLLQSLSVNLKEKVKSQFKLIQSQLNSLLELNYQVTLTCNKISDLFGFKSASQGHSIQRKLVSINRIRSTSQRSLRIAKNISSSILNSLHLDSSFFISNNCLFKRLPNLITII